PGSSQCVLLPPPCVVHPIPGANEPNDQTTNSGATGSGARLRISVNRATHPSRRSHGSANQPTPYIWQSTRLPPASIVVHTEPQRCQRTHGRPSIRDLFQQSFFQLSPSHEPGRVRGCLSVPKLPQRYVPSVPFFDGRRGYKARACDGQTNRGD